MLILTFILNKIQIRNGPKMFNFEYLQYYLYKLSYNIKYCYVLSKEFTDYFMNSHNATLKPIQFV